MYNNKSTVKVVIYRCSKGAFRQPVEAARGCTVNVVPKEKYISTLEHYIVTMRGQLGLIN